MADLRFYQGLGPITITEIAALSGAAISDSAPGSLTVNDVAPLEAAQAGKLSYVESAKILAALPEGALTGAVLIAMTARRLPPAS